MLQTPTLTVLFAVCANAKEYNAESAAGTRPIFVSGATDKAHQGETPTKTEHAWRSTSDISEKDAAWRAQLYTGLFVCGATFLVLISLLVTIRKTGKCEIPVPSCAEAKLRIKTHDLLPDIKYLFRSVTKTCCALKKTAVGNQGVVYTPVHMEGDLEMVGQARRPDKAITAPGSTASLGADLGSQSQQTPGDRAAKITTEEFGLKVSESFKHKAEVVKWKRRRASILSMLFALYIAACTYMPWHNASHTSCDRGFFWEDHVPFGAIFFVSKVIEILLYVWDPSLDGVLPMWQFLLLFVPSFLGYLDAYQDYTSTFISKACFKHPSVGVDHELAGLLARTMTWSFWIGVVLLQWIFLGFLAIFYDGGDASLALLAKLVHMDALSMCIDVPPELLWMIYVVNAVRLFGEDIPQALQQLLFVLHVKKNPFMIMSIMFSIFCSGKTLYDACNRLASAAGKEERLKEIVEERLLEIRQGRDDYALRAFDLQRRGYSIREVLAAGCQQTFTAEEISQAGWCQEDYKDAGVTVLIEAGFSSDDYPMTDNFNFDELAAAYGEAPRFEGRLFGDNQKVIWSGQLFIEISKPITTGRWFEGNFVLEWGENQTWLGRRVDDDKILTCIVKKSFHKLSDDDIRSANPTYPEYFKAKYIDSTIHDGDDDPTPYTDEREVRTVCDADEGCKGYFCHADSGKFHLVRDGAYTYSTADHFVRFIKLKRSQATIDGKWTGGTLGNLEVFGHLIFFERDARTRKIVRLSATAVQYEDITYELQADGIVRSSNDDYWQRMI